MHQFAYFSLLALISLPLSSLHKLFLLQFTHEAKVTARQQADPQAPAKINSLIIITFDNMILN